MLKQVRLPTVFDYLFHYDRQYLINSHELCPVNMLNEDHMREACSIAATPNPSLHSDFMTFLQQLFACGPHPATRIFRMRTACAPIVIRLYCVIRSAYGIHAVTSRQPYAVRIHAATNPHGIRHSISIRYPCSNCVSAVYGPHSRRL